MTATMTKPMAEFNKAAEAVGVIPNDRRQVPFLALRDKAGYWVTGTMTGERLNFTFTPKKGKNKGKKQSCSLYFLTIETTNIPGVDSGDQVSISVDGGLLGYQLTKGLPAGVSYPYPVAILYTGKDSEGRHQTEVRFPKA